MQRLFGKQIHGKAIGGSSLVAFFTHTFNVFHSSPLLSLKANFYLSSVAKRYSNDIPVKNVSRIFIASGNVNANFPLILSLVLLSVFPITRLMSDIETPYLTISALKFLVTISPPSTLRGGFYCYITTFNGGSQEVFPPLKEIFFLICIKRYAILLIERGCA